MRDNFGPVIEGIELPETLILPPQVIQLMPYMNQAELKIVLATVARLMQVGAAEPITLTEFEEITGLSRASVLAGIRRAMRRGLLCRFELSGYQGHRTHAYELKIFIGSKSIPMKPLKAKPRQEVVDDSVATTRLLNLALANQENAPMDADLQRKNDLYDRLRKIGIYPKTAQRLVNDNALERIERFLSLYPHALRAGRAEGPGWLVAAVVDTKWDPDVEQADLEARLAGALPEIVPAKKSTTPKKSVLPKKILEGLNQLGWVGSTAEVEEVYKKDKKQLEGWLRWALTQPEQYRAARFRNGIRSGRDAPKVPTTDSRSYIAGDFSKFIDH